MTPRTKAVIFVDALGSPAGLSDIKAICTQHGLPLIEDAACAIGSAEHGVRCGAIADLTCFSFHPRKLISTGEGGAITTHNDAWADWLAVKLAHGAQGMKGMALDFVDYGYNFRMSELQAVMGRKQLAKIDAIVDERNALRQRYVAQLAPLGFVAQATGDDVRHNVQSLVFKVPTGCDRDALDLTVELITHRFTPGSKEVLEGWYPNSSLEMDESGRAVKRNKFGGLKYVYTKEVMTELRGFFETEVALRFPDAEVLYWT